MRYKVFCRTSWYSTIVPQHVVLLNQCVDPLSLRSAVSEVTLAFTMSGVDPGLKW